MTMLRAVCQKRRNRVIVSGAPRRGRRQWRKATPERDRAPVARSFGVAGAARWCSEHRGNGRGYLGEFQI
jgi:hypothetical protein